MSDAEQNAEIALGFIEATNNLADAMDAIKRALEERGWSTPVAEHVGAAFGSQLFSLIQPPKPPRRR